MHLACCYIYQVIANHRHYIYNKSFYFLKELITLSIYQKSFINNNIVNKIKYMY